VAAFRVAQRGEQVAVSLTAPLAYTDGSRLPVLEVELLRADQAGDFAKQAKTRRLRAAPGERLVENEPLPPPGTQLRFATRVAAKGKESPLSGVATLTVQAPPPAPSELAVRRMPGGLALDWHAPPIPELLLPAAPPSGPTSPTPASPPAAETALPAVPAPSPSASASPAAATSGFWVYRRPATGRYQEPLSTTPLAAPPFQDSETTAETLCYVVRTVMATDPLIESIDSNEVCVPPEMPAPSAGAER
jgi:hypothetical protein